MFACFLFSDRKKYSETSTKRRPSRLHVSLTEGVLLTRGPLNRGFTVHIQSGQCSR